MLWQMALIILAYFIAWYIVSVVIKNASIIDIGWGLGFVIVAWVGFLQNITWASALVTALVSLWGLRLAYHIFKRNHGQPEDYRYANFRKVWGKNYYVRAFFQLFMFQGLMMLIISLGFIHVNSTGSIVNLPLAIIGALVWLIGYIFEVVGDAQLRKFVSNPDNKGKILDTGLWRYTRHPNYFGEAVLWWGIFIIALGAGAPWYTVLSPLTINILVRYVSGVPMLEKRLAQRKEFAEYMENTSVFIPWFSKSDSMTKNIFLVLQFVFLAGFLAFLVAIIYGVTARDFWAEGRVLVGIYWGRFTLYDIYLAFAVFYLWIVYREKSLLSSIIWFFLIMLGGAMTICLYMFVALRTSDNSSVKLMLGKRWVNQNAE